MIRTIVTPSGVVLRARVVQLQTTSEALEQHKAPSKDFVRALEALYAEELDAQEKR